MHSCTKYAIYYIYVPVACTGNYLSNAAYMHVVTNDIIAKIGMQTTSPNHSWT
jgi:hypothetical protein